MSSLVHGEVGELGERGEPELGEAAPHEVLDGLDVVAGGRLESASSSISAWPKSAGEGAERAGLLGARAGCEPNSAVVGEREQPLDLDLHARPVEPRLGEVLAEAVDGGAVAPVERAERLRGQAGS